MILVHHWVGRSYPNLVNAVSPSCPNITARCGYMLTLTRYGQNKIAYFQKVI